MGRGNLTPILGVGILLALLVSSAASIYHHSWDEYFDFSVSELIRVVIIVVMGTYIAKSVNFGNMKATKATEHALNMLSQIEDVTDEIFQQWQVYATSLDAERAKEVKLKLKRLSRLITDLEQLEASVLARSRKTASPNLLDAFNDFKSRLTGGDFGRDEGVYSSEEKLPIEHQYDLFKAQINSRRNSTLV